MQNYFNYFTEIEHYYQSKRESFTLLSTLDWILIETWKDEGIPLELIQKGIDRAFSRAKRKVSSLAYCANAISEVMTEQKGLRTEAPDLPEFSTDEIESYLEQLARQIQQLSATFPEFKVRLDSIAKTILEQSGTDLQAAEQTLNALEEKLIAIIKIAAEEKVLITIQKDVDSSLGPFRRTMTTEQLVMLEQQLWKRKLMEYCKIPRLSLFYLI